MHGVDSVVRKLPWSLISKAKVVGNVLTPCRLMGDMTIWQCLIYLPTHLFLRDIPVLVQIRRFLRASAPHTTVLEVVGVVMRNACRQSLLLPACPSLIKECYTNYGSTTIQNPRRVAGTKIMHISLNMTLHKPAPTQAYNSY